MWDGRARASLLAFCRSPALCSLSTTSLRSDSFIFFMPFTLTAGGANRGFRGPPPPPISGFRSVVDGMLVSARLSSTFFSSASWPIILNVAWTISFSCQNARREGRRLPEMKILSHCAVIRLPIRSARDDAALPHRPPVIFPFSASS